MFSLIPRKRDLYPDFFTPYSDLDSFFSDLRSKYFGEESNETTRMPAINIYSQDGSTVVEASLPNYDKEDIDVEVNDGILTINGRHEEKSETSKKDYYYREFSQGSFTRSIKLPEGVNTEDIKAKHEDGVLKITFPAVETEKKPSKVKVE
ncbi:MAG: Hsp20/alpha crystallin family protein [Vulcanimicrobiota bacterium]